MDLLRMTPGQRFKQANDPYGYDILADQHYLHELQFVHLSLLGEDEKEQKAISD